MSFISFSNLHWNRVAGLVDQMTAMVFRQSYMTQLRLCLHWSTVVPLCFHLLWFSLTIGLLHAMAFMVLLLVGWIIWNNKPLSITHSLSIIVDLFAAKIAGYMVWYGLIMHLHFYVNDIRDRNVNLRIDSKCKKFTMKFRCTIPWFNSI